MQVLKSVATSLGSKTNIVDFYVGKFISFKASLKKVHDMLKQNINNRCALTLFEANSAFHDSNVLLRDIWTNE